MLTLGEFETELDFSMEPTVRDSFVKANIIGDSTDEDSLKTYADQVLLRLIEQVLVADMFYLQDIV